MPTFRVAALGQAKHKSPIGAGAEPGDAAGRPAGDVNAHPRAQLDSAPEARDRDNPLSTSTVELGEVDPLAEDPTAGWYVRAANGEQLGPAQADVMRRWITAGQVPPDALVWRDGWPHWRRAAEVFTYEADSVIGSDFDFDPDWLRPAAAPISPSAPDDAELVGGLAKATSAGKSAAQRRFRITVTALAVAVVALIPVLIYVLTR